MYEVLMAVDENRDRALAQAGAVADLPVDTDEIHVTILHVFTGDNVEGASVSDVGAVRRARERLEEHGIDVSLDEDSGNAPEEILDAVEEHDVDLVTVAGRRRSPAGKALLGSSSQEILLHSPEPVLFCGVGGGD